MSDDVNLEEFVMTKDEFSGADIKAICTEAGLLALRERRMKVRVLVVTDIMSINFICTGLGLVVSKDITTAHVYSPKL